MHEKIPDQRQTVESLDQIKQLRDTAQTAVQVELGRENTPDVLR